MRQKHVRSAKLAAMRYSTADSVECMQGNGERCAALQHCKYSAAFKNGTTVHVRCGHHT